MSFSTTNNKITIVSIEGNIGSGKTTLVELLKSRFASCPPSFKTAFVFLEEPVDEWNHIRDADGTSILQKFYADQEKYSFSFQMMAYISRLTILKRTVEDIQRRNSDMSYVIVTERSLFTDRYVFAKMLFTQGKMENVCYQIYLKWFDEFIREYPIDYFVYLRTMPQKCYERVHKRAREGEELIPLEYLVECHDYHQTFLDEIDGTKKVINGDIDDIGQVYEVADLWFQETFCPVIVTPAVMP